MSDDRKPIWPWIVALLSVVLVAYPLSIGPADWLLFQRPLINFRLARNVHDIVYQPIWFVADQSAFTSEALFRYRNLFVPSYIDQLILDLSETDIQLPPLDRPKIP